MADRKKINYKVFNASTIGSGDVAISDKQVVRGLVTIGTLWETSANVGSETEDTTGVTSGAIKFMTQIPKPTSRKSPSSRVTAKYR